MKSSLPGWIRGQLRDGILVAFEILHHRFMMRRQVLNRIYVEYIIVSRLRALSDLERLECYVGFVAERIGSAMAGNLEAKV